MGIPHVPNQVRRAPTLVLRAVFAGVGRVLLSTERPPATAEPEAAHSAGDGEQARRPAGRRQRQGRAPVAPPGSRWRSLDKTGNVRLLSDEDVDDDFRTDPGRSRTGRKPAPAPLADRLDRRPRPAPPKPALPLASYDELSLASIRARLRGLDVSQLRILAEYESKNAERPEVLGMFERRISKLEAGELPRTPGSPDGKLG
ncbi:MAG TPA: hypothetical protein VMA72_01890 [Streptosporangiaceae bacterium]|nr:hypothetical protein [Streptosporangiaceae bacterium]